MACTAETPTYVDLLGSVSERKKLVVLTTNQPTTCYMDLTYGYARGNEPVQYVTRIRDYNDILERHFKKQKPPANPAASL